MPRVEYPFSSMYDHYKSCYSASQRLFLSFNEATSARRDWIAESTRPSSGPTVGRRHDLPSPGFPYETVQWPRRQGRPVDVTTDAINDLGVKILDRYVQHQRGNVAFSPSGLGFVLVALYEGAAGSSAREISDVLGLPRDRRVTRIGLRDIHRRLRSYLNADAFLGGLTLNRDDINLREDYERILRFYGFDISDSAMENNESTSSTGNVTESSNESNGDEVETLPSTKLNEAGRGLTTVASTVSGTSASSSPVSNVPTNASFSPAIVASTTESTTISIDPTVIDGPTSSVPITNDNVATTTSTSPFTLAVNNGVVTTTSTSPSILALNGNVATTTSTSPFTLAVNNSVATTTSTSTLATSDTVATATSNLATNDAVETTATSNSATSDTIATTATSNSATNDAVATATSTPATNDAVATATSTLTTDNAVATATSTLATNDAVATATSTLATNNTVAMATSTLATNNTVATATSTLATNNSVATATSTLATNDAVATPSMSTPAAAILPENVVTETSMRRRRGLFHGPLGYFSASPPDTADVWLDEVYGRLNDNEDYPSEKEGGGGEGGEDSRRPTEIVFLVNGCDYSRVTGATYTAFLPFSHFASLRASLLEFPLDDPRYKILVMLPSEATNGTRDLARTLATRPITLRKLRGSLGATWLTAVVPSFMLRGFVTLTPYLQRLGISDVFDPRAADLTPMSPDLGVYARDVQQSIGLDIRNNAKDGGRGIGSADGGNEEPKPRPRRRRRRRRQRGVHSLRGALLAPPLPFFLAGGPVSPRFHGNSRYPSYSGPLYESAAPVVPFVVDRPFLYFIVDDETSVTLLAGRIDDPLNSRLL